VVDRVVLGSEVLLGGGATLELGGGEETSSEQDSSELDSELSLSLLLDFEPLSFDFDLLSSLEPDSLASGSSKRNDSSSGVCDLHLGEKKVGLHCIRIIMPLCPKANGNVPVKAFMTLATLFV
jgi:hypothetical protein